jgi:hypothetical protein
MLSLREAAIFLAGAQTFHTLSHVWLRFSGLLPLRLRMPSMTWTVAWNDGAVALNAVFTALLYWWVWQL